MPADEPNNPWADWLPPATRPEWDRLAHIEAGEVTLRIQRKSGETFLLVNEGDSPVYMPEIEGLTDIDKRRLLEVAAEPASLGSGQAKEFILASRYALSGPANVVVSFRLEPGGPLLRRVLDVPSP